MPTLSLPDDVGAPALVPARRMQPRRHGGAWKVAYADFVTALMALFIVLWLMNSSDKVKASVTGYFRDPKGYTRTLGAGPAGSGEGLKMDRRSLPELQKQIQQAMRKMPEFEKIRGNIVMSVTGEGLRIDLLETDKGMFFVAGNAAPTAWGQRLLETLGRELGRMPNPVVVEGHTDARPFRNTGPANVYTNWELAADRANAARRLLNGSGVRAGQVKEVRGFADQKLFNEKDPFDPRNRRVSVVVKLE
jgi:chemotaxis protein MotB